MSNSYYQGQPGSGKKLLWFVKDGLVQIDMAFIAEMNRWTLIAEFDWGNQSLETIETARCLILHATNNRQLANTGAPHLARDVLQHLGSGWVLSVSELHNWITQSLPVYMQYLPNQDCPSCG